jgi:hypothetical protein
VHAHTVLMLAAVGVVAAFVPIVLVVRWLEGRGRISDGPGSVSVRGYGAIIAGGFSAGSAALQLALIGDHAIQSARTPGDAAVFLCSVGVATSHVTTVDASVVAFLPIGAATLLVGPAQALWSVPRLWRDSRVALIGVVLAAAALALAVGRIVVNAAVGASPAGDITTTVLLLEGILAILVATLVSGRPRRLVERLDARPADAWVAIGLGLAAAAILTATAIWADRVAH